MHTTKDIGRLFFAFLEAPKDVRLFEHTHAWETDGKHRFAPHVFVVRLFPLRRVLVLGWWHDTEVTTLHDEYGARISQEAADAAFDAYTQVNGQVDRAAWDAARRTIASHGLDPDEEMEIMQAMGVFE